MGRPRFSKADGVFFACILILLSLFWYRCSYGIAMDGDEIAYLVSLKRFLQGDFFFLHDWHGMQCTSWILRCFFGILPNGGAIVTDILFMRYVYVVFQLIVTMFVYGMLRKEGLGGVLAALLFFCAVPYNLFALSYNTVSIAFITLCLVWIFSKRTDWKNTQLILCGFLFAVAVLSYPHVVLIYFIYAAICVANRTVLRKKEGFFCIRTLGLITAGCLILAIPFLISLVGKAEVGDYVENFNRILRDTEHQKSGGLKELAAYVWSVIRVYWIPVIPIGICGIITIFYKKESNRKWLFLSTCAFALLGILKFAYSYGSVYVNLMWVPLGIAGIECLLLLNDVKEKKRYATWLIGGILFTVAVWLGTNTGILSTSAAWIVPSMASCCLIISCAKECLTEKWQKVMPWLVLGVQLLAAVHLRMTYLFLEAPMDELKVSLQKGPGTGIMTTAENAEQYERLLSVLEDCCLEENNNVLFLPIKPLPYLFADSRCAAPYPTRFEVAATELFDYYGLHPEKLPDKIVILDGAAGKIEDEQERLLVDYFTDQGYITEVHSDTCIMIRRP